METFEGLQQRLGPTLELNRPGRDDPHVLIALPSFSVGESMLSHYADRIPSLEHRYLLAALMLGRIPGCEMIYLSCADPGDDMIDYYASLGASGQGDGIRSRFRPVVVPDRSARSVAAKLLDRDDVVDQLKEMIGDRPAFIEPWNVTAAEEEVAVRLGVPINGTPPDLWPLGFKSAGRKLFRRTGVPTPYGHEDVRTVDDVVAAVVDIAVARPDAPGAVIKHDDSGAGDGNVVLRFDTRSPELVAVTKATVAALPDWYLHDLARGGVVEELVAGTAFATPSVQVDIEPDGNVRVLSTHEQDMQGEDAQVYSGCRFPADPVYVAELAAHGRAVGAELARLGALGRFSLDFAAARRADGRWDVYALEVNLRKGGTTHPYTALRHLVPGRYDEAAGRWVANDGSTRSYAATDNMQHDSWRELDSGEVLRAVRDAGLEFDADRGTGVVLHMLSCLAIDGRFGLVAIGRSAGEATELSSATCAAVDGLVGRVG